MRHEHDEERDIVRTYFTDEAIVGTVEEEQYGGRIVTHFDASNKPVLVEIFGASKVQEGAAERHSRRLPPVQADPEDDRLLFTLDWTFVDFDDQANPISGTTPVRLCDFTIDGAESKDATVVRKTFKLNDRLEFSLADSGCETPNGSGMALQVSFTEPGTFSWEWFAPKGDRLVKIQEVGEMLPSYRRVGDRFEVADLTLVTDVSLRFQNMLDGPHAERFHRINLKAGTLLRWPSLVDGKVTMP